MKTGEDWVKPQNESTSMFVQDDIYTQKYCHSSIAMTEYLIKIFE